MDLVVHILSNSVHEESSTMDTDSSFARRRLYDLFHREPIKTRSLAWHAAQIIGIANEFTVHAPCETMRVFMGHLLLLAIVSSRSLVSLDTHRADYGASVDPVRLDQPSWNQGPQGQVAVDNWIKNGGPARVGAVTDICDPLSFPVLRRSALSTMQKMRVWGLASKFYKILEVLEL